MPTMSGTFAAIFGFEGSKKWMARLGRAGTSRTGAGAPTARGAKKSLALRMRPERSSDRTAADPSLRVGYLWVRLAPAATGPRKVTRSARIPLRRAGDAETTHSEVIHRSRSPGVAGTITGNWAGMAYVDAWEARTVPARLITPSRALRPDDVAGGVAPTRHRAYGPRWRAIGGGFFVPVGERSVEQRILEVATMAGAIGDGTAAVFESATRSAAPARNARSRTRSSGCAIPTSAWWRWTWRSRQS